jgi:hypothetical protein
MLFLLADKVEAALAAVIAPAVSGLQILTGKSSGTKGPPPAIICVAEEDGDEDPIHSGNFFVNCRVEIKCSEVPNQNGTDDEGAEPPDETEGFPPDERKLRDEALVAAVFSDIRVSDLASRLSAAVADLTVFEGSVVFEGAERDRDEHGVSVDTLRFRCLACGSALAP